jgi:hypothetical protein
LLGYELDALVYHKGSLKEHRKITAVVNINVLPLLPKLADHVLGREVQVYLGSGQPVMP